MIVLQPNGLVAYNDKPIAIAWFQNNKGWFATSCSGDYLSATDKGELIEGIQKLIKKYL